MIQNLKDLERLLKLCRAQGVMEIKLDTVEFKLGDLPYEPSKEAAGAPGQSLTGFPDGVLTDEQLMFYSAGGVPSDDPFLKAQGAA